MRIIALKSKRHNYPTQLIYLQTTSLSTSMW
jgi:hypothetical protein